MYSGTKSHIFEIEELTIKYTSKQVENIFSQIHKYLHTHTHILHIYSITIQFHKSREELKTTTERQHNKVYLKCNCSSS